MSSIYLYFRVAILAAVLCLAPNAVRAQLAAGGNGNASGTPSIAISAATGGAAQATATDTIAIGRGATASGIGATAIGSAITAPTASGNDSIAIGTNAQASAIGSTSIGLNSAASASNAVAIGTGSVANQANTVSVGSAGNERRVTNVAAGTTGTDAVNVNQLNAVAIGGAGPQVDALTSRMGALESRVDDLTRNTYRGIAGVAALSGTMPMSPGRISVNVGAATYQGYGAVGAQIGYLSDNGRYNFSGGMSQSAGKPVGRVSAGFTF